MGNKSVLHILDSMFLSEAGVFAVSCKPTKTDKGEVLRTAGNSRSYTNFRYCTSGDGRLSQQYGVKKIGNQFFIFLTLCF